MDIGQRSVFMANPDLQLCLSNTFLCKEDFISIYIVYIVLPTHPKPEPYPNIVKHVSDGMKKNKVSYT